MLRREVDGEEVVQVFEDVFLGRHPTTSQEPRTHTHCSPSPACRGPLPSGNTLAIWRGSLGRS